MAQPAGCSSSRTTARSAWASSFARRARGLRGRRDPHRARCVLRSRAREIGDSVTVKTTRGRERDAARHGERSRRRSGAGADGEHRLRLRHARHAADARRGAVPRPAADPGGDPAARRVRAHPRGRRATSGSSSRAAAIAVSRIDIPTPGKHPHADIMGLLLLAMAGFGSLVLVLERHPRGQPAGGDDGRADPADRRDESRRRNALADRARSTSARLSFSDSPRSCSPFRSGSPAAACFCRSHGRASSTSTSRASRFRPGCSSLVVAVGIVVPLLAAAWPVWKGSGVSIREALADFGVPKNAFGASGFDRALSGIGGRPGRCSSPCATASGAGRVWCSPW